MDDQRDEQVDPPRNAAASENRRNRVIAAAIDGDRSLDPELFARMQDELSRPPARARPLLALALLPLSAALVLGLRTLASGRVPLRFDFAGLPARGFLGYGLLCLCIGAAFAAIGHRNPRGFGFSSTTLRWTAWIVAAVVGVAPLLTRGFGPPPPLHVLGAPCALIVTSSGALALFLAAIALRHTQPIATQARAWVLGAATAAWVGLVISLHCPGESLTHLLWGHSLPMILIVPLAALLLPRFLRP